MQVPTLGYHNISAGTQVGLNTVSPSRFKKHISGLARFGMQGITTFDSPDEDSIMITFDDGYEDIFQNAFPVCQNYGFRAIVFQLADYIGINNDWDINFYKNNHLHLSKDQLLKLVEAGWEIGSHGCHHQAYSGLKYSEIYADMAVSKEKLENLIGKEVHSFTAPFNMMVPTIYQIAEELAYKYIFLQKPLSTISENKTKVKIIERRSVYSFDMVKNLIKKIENKSRYEIYKENIIHFCSNATIGTKKLI